MFTSHVHTDHYQAAQPPDVGDFDAPEKPVRPDTNAINPGDSNLHEATALNALRQTELLHDVLPHEDMMTLVIQAQSGSKTARDRLITSNMKLVFGIANKIPRGRTPIEDLTHEGVFGLITAIERFDVSKGFRFSTYAYHWIHQSIVRYLQNNARTIRLPADIGFKQRDYINAVTQCKAKGETVNRRAIADAMGVEHHRLETILSMPIHGDSISAPFGQNSEGKGVTWLDTLSHDEEREAEFSFTQDSAAKQLRTKCAQHLNQQEYKVVMYRFGFYGDPMVLSNIAGILGLTRERIRQIEIQALKKLRKLSDNGTSLE